jgi:hypothetical protein
MAASSPRVSSIALSWRFRGECLFSLKRHADAVVAFDRASAIGGRGAEDVFLWAALALHNGGRQDEAKARAQVEFYRSFRVTGPVQRFSYDVSHDTRPSVAIMVAHCCLCGGITYHDF